MHTEQSRQPPPQTPLVAVGFAGDDAEDIAERILAHGDKQALSDYVGSLITPQDQPPCDTPPTT